LNKATVFYRLPNTNQIVKKSGLIEGDLKPIDLTNVSKENCFYISPFGSENKAYKCHLNKEINTFEIIKYADFKGDGFQDNEQQFKLKVKTAVNTLKTSKYLKKVVLARNSKVNLNEEVNLNVFFLNLCLNYPSAFVYAVSSSVTGTWVAATPELLFDFDGEKIETVALAGTLKNGEQTTWTEKEIEEQRWVELFIEGLIEKHKMELLQKEGPKDLITGNLKHLCTHFKIKANLSNASVFLEGLNPTPAVCGLPTEDARKLINQIENLNRKFYTGFVGISDQSGIKLFVNLRCMELGKNQINLYAGCGITSKSDENNEWIETDNKLKNLSRFLT
jgi:isochorismate synthase